MNVPGTSVEQLINAMGLPALTQLLGKELVDTLEHLSGAQVEIDEIRKVALVLYGGNNAKTIRAPESRNKFIDSLPLEKAQELCVKLGFKPVGNLYTQLKKVDKSLNPSLEKVLFSFFGIVDDPTVQQLRKPAVAEVIPKYGLFDHQRDVAQRVFDAIRHPPRKVLIHMPTGAGKTRTAMHIVARHMKQVGPTLVCWLANSAELLEQAAEDFEMSWGVLGDRPVKVYRFWGDRTVDLKEVRDGFLVAGYAKMYAAYQREANILMCLGDRASMTVVDEAHQAIAPTYRSTIEGLYAKRPENCLLGLTATPGRTWADIDKDAALSDFFGGAKVTLTVEGYADPVSFLIGEGYLAKPRFRQLQSTARIDLSASEAKTLESTNELPESVVDRISGDAERNFLIISAIEELLAQHRRIIVFGASVRHATLIAGILLARDHDAQIITGETPIARRERIIRKFKSEDLRPMVLCNYGVLTTGFDAPQTSAAVIARPTRSLVLYSQMVGRATRGPRAGGNEFAEIVTVIDTMLPGFGSVTEAFYNWEDVWNEHGQQ